MGQRARKQKNSLYDGWKTCRNKIMEGTILNIHDDFIQIDIGDMWVQAYMNRNEWVAREKNKYVIGKKLWFWCYNVRKNPSVFLTLSRSRKELPAALLTDRWQKVGGRYKFETIKRFPGRKTIIHTDAPLRDGRTVYYRNEVSKELHGEILEIRTLKSNQDILKNTII